MASVELSGVRKRFRDAEVIRGIDLAIADGELVVVVGPSGCGKSTLLRLICGLEPASEGDIRIGGRSVRDLPPSQRGVAMVFQSYALYPHMTAAENMGFSLRIAKLPEEERKARVERAARILRLEELLERRPKELSGGQRQRVAIGRAIVREPDAFLFDEPLSNLDAELRVQMRLELAKLHRALGATMIHVTHDQVEAMTLADRIVVMRAGAVEQVGTPMELYDEPANLFVAGFIGSPRMNFLAARIVETSGEAVRLRMDGLEPAELSLPAEGACCRAGDAVTLGVRPEHLRPDGDGPSALDLRVEFVERLGGTNYAYAPGHPAGMAVLRQDGDGTVRRGDRIKARLDPKRCHLFDADGIRIPSRDNPAAP